MAKYQDQSTYEGLAGSTADSCGNCPCCPIGTIAVYDANGKFSGCLTPQDAELYKASLVQCAAGFVKLINPHTNEFVGCVSVADFPALYQELCDGCIECEAQFGSVVDENADDQTDAIEAGQTNVVGYVKLPESATLDSVTFTINGVPATEVWSITGIANGYYITFPALIADDVLVFTANYTDSSGNPQTCVTTKTAIA